MELSRRLNNRICKTLPTAADAGCSVRFAIGLRWCLQRISDSYNGTNSLIRLKKHCTMESKSSMITGLSLEGSTPVAPWYLLNQPGCVNERGTLLPKAGKNRHLWNTVHLVLNRWVWEAARFCMKRNKATIQWQKYSYITQAARVFGGVSPALKRVRPWGGGQV